MDRFHELTAFITVVEAGGFSAAARRLDDSQSGMSKSISALEKRLGVLLFNRSTRSVTLTDQGRKYYDRIKPLLEEMDEADGELTSSSLEVSGLVRIAAPSTFGRLHVLPLIPQLLALHPKIKLDLGLSDSVRDLLADGIDLAIRVGPVHDPDAVVKRVTGTSLVCVGSRHYFARHEAPTVPEDLVSHNCLVYNEMTNWAFGGPKGEFSVPVSGNLSSNSMETILSGVLAGIGIGMFSRASLVGELQHPDIVTVLDPFMNEARDVSLIWPKRRFVPARVRLVTDFFVTTLSQRV
ncbi:MULTISPECIES: LysR family transcriptional regulator [Paraburkholderia]|uniref:LysR family transcriptional regulator n=1 Tax=Paraburkholderia TaxID=1822464 RepID=UPI00190BAF56|nr:MULTISPECIES: LysR family transcriptional regulator [Paraburkholderia]MBK3840894.1 LysR family transcriptional regulator [Paraburkholderia aspalathi]MCX4155398.1 LysR family transcriptional regulator [Paraburkholderia aspalathi]MDN7164807.1 LysR family transcriptional regulator [Paraburkholderia sp. SECH2]MDQ6393293.1 LysR family transcriptional regulator [Paraburkholderia aspalathi]CAE6791748.1 HTH-type transcriptional regulator DmlR [Paraburkholderia aspalathi]